MKIPNSVIVVVSEALSRFTHKHIDSLLLKAIPFTELPTVEGTKVEKCRWWLDAANDDDVMKTSLAPLAFLGEILEEYMDYEIPRSRLDIVEWEADRERVERALAKHGLCYEFGGVIRSRRVSTPARILAKALKDRNLHAVEEEFQRLDDAVDTDPRGSLTSACALLEALFKVYIEDEKLPMPKDQTVKPLWNAVSKNLGLDPARLEDDDLKRILSGMTSIVDGLGALRTHAGSAHGRGRGQYRPKARHARLAINAACGLATFVLETWKLA